MDTFSIGEAARRAGVAPSALRFYERKGIIPKPARIGGKRRYTPELVRAIETARFAQSVGFTLQEVRQLFGGARDWRPLAQAKLRHLDDTIRRARRMKKAIEAGLACGCLRADQCTRR